MPPKVHDRGDDDGVSLDGVEKTVWESVHPAPAMVGRDLRPGFRLEEDPLDCALDFVQEVEAETRHGLFVVVRRGGDIRLGGREETECHFPYRARSSRRTEGPSRA